MNQMNWPYQNEFGQTERLESDVLVLGGGIAGCWAAIAAAKKGASVILVEKGATIRSGAGGSGCDHWESAATNPCSGVTPEELVEAMLDDQDYYNNGISHYIECREGYDRILDIESYGAKVRDTEDEFKGAAFRDEKTKFLFAYDYKNKYTLRIWGSTFKPALYRECLRLGVKIMDRTMATSLLTSVENGKKRGVGATAINVHTGKFYVLHAKATILTMSRPARVWLFNPDLVGLCEFRPTQCIGNGHAMGFRAGIEFTMMEKSVVGEFSAAGRSFPPYGAGNNHNTWFACTMVDADGREIPYVDRDGNILKSVEERYYPAKGQKFFMMGGNIDNPKYEIQGPDIMSNEKLRKRGYKFPLYSDMSKMPEMERKVIWDLMLKEEGKAKIPIRQDFINRGFDPTKHRIQSYGSGWKSASFLPQERQLFGLPGGVVNDWELKTNIDGIYAAGDQLFASNCNGHAAATGHYAGRHAADYALHTEFGTICEEDAEREMKRVYAPMKVEDGVDWKELNMAVSKAMQIYCGDNRCKDFMLEGLDLLKEYEETIVPNLSCKNPHELMRTLEAVDILEVSKLILHACLMRESSSRALCFERTDFPEMDPEKDRKFITIRQENGEIIRGELPLDYYGNLKENYELHNREYMESLKDRTESGI